MSFLQELNPKQREAVKAVEGPVIVIAGPGSGKTRVLTYRIAYLISIGVPAYSILALTFTNKAADEMKQRIIKLVGEKSSQLWMGTFHSVFARILRVEAVALGYGKNFTIYDTIDSLGVIKGIMEAMGISAQRFNPQAIRSRISGAKNQLVTPAEYAQRTTDIFEERTAQIFAEYQKRLKQNNAMDFDDLLLKPIEVFNTHPAILSKYQDRFRFILVDEYQDTNRAQYVLIKTLASKHRNIAVVGDDAQSIYAFRGADIRNILDFEHDYPDAKIIRLEQNYRSTKTILSAADQVIKKNIDQILKNLWTENHPGETITVIGCEDDRDEGMTIVAKIYDESRKLKIDLKDFAIMYRTNAQSRSIEDALRRNSLSYTIVGGIEFYQRKEVKDILAYIRILVNPQDGESFLRIINYPTRGIGDVAIEHLRTFSEKERISLLEAAGRAGEIAGPTMKARNALRGLHATFAKYIRMMNEMSPGEIVRALVDETGILPLLKDEGTVEATSRWENIQELLSAVTEFTEKRNDATLEMFLQDVSLVSALDEWDGSHNAVTLMTLHSAKGLEFPVVFIAGLEEGLLPFYNSAIDRKDLEEERRLYYVGITRAMKKLYLTHARVRYRFGEATYQTPSRFLEEMDAGLFEVTSNVQRYTQPTVNSSWEFPERKTVHRKGSEDDARYFRDEMPDYDGNVEELVIGKMVEHAMFGRGKILAIGGSGESLKAVVDFPTVGRKSLLLRYAKLKIL